jgi:hypothetical protein
MNENPNPWELLLDEQAVKAAEQVVAAHIAGDVATLADELKLLTEEQLAVPLDELPAKIVSLLGAFSAFAYVGIHAEAYAVALMRAKDVWLDQDEEIETTRDDDLAALEHCVQLLHTWRHDPD